MKEWSDDIDIMSLAISKDSTHAFSVFSLASDRLKDLDEFVMMAVSQNGMCLKNASERLRDNEKIVLKAIDGHASALKYASERLRNDKEIVTKAICRSAYALSCASNELRNNKEFIFNLLLDKKLQITEGVGELLQDDEEFAYECIVNSSENYKYLSKRLKGKYEVLEHLMNKYPINLIMAPDEFQNNRLLLERLENFITKKMHDNWNQDTKTWCNQKMMILEKLRESDVLSEKLEKTKVIKKRVSKF